VDAAFAALIGAGVGSVTSVASQFVGHNLELRRDRRDQHRDRARVAIEAAAKALFVTRTMTEEEYAARNFRPDSVGAQRPDQVMATSFLFDEAFGAMTQLQVELGRDHPLVSRYDTTITVCAKALRLGIEARKLWGGPMTPEVEEMIKRDARAMLEAQNARFAWVAEAREVLDGI